MRFGLVLALPILSACALVPPQASDIKVQQFVEQVDANLNALQVAINEASSQRPKAKQVGLCLATVTIKMSAVNGTGGSGGVGADVTESLELSTRFSESATQSNVITVTKVPEYSGTVNPLGTVSGVGSDGVPINLRQEGNELALYIFEVRNALIGAQATSEAKNAALRATTSKLKTEFEFKVIRKSETKLGFEFPPFGLSLGGSTSQSSISKAIVEFSTAGINKRTGLCGTEESPAYPLR